MGLALKSYILSVTKYILQSWIIYMGLALKSYILRVTKYILQSCIIYMGLALKSKDTVVYRKSETGLTYV